MKNDKLLHTLHEQFAENQNHHQGIFIQILVALFILFGGFGYIYVCTNPLIDYNSSLILAHNNVWYFSNIILLAVTFVVLLVLLLLNLIILHLGNSFRRDQLINMKIRKEELGNDVYRNIFGKLYNPLKKNIWNFLPNFYMIFYSFITCFQIFVFIAICNKDELTCFFMKPIALIMFVLSIATIGLSFLFYYKTFLKYRKME